MLTCHSCTRRILQSIVGEFVILSATGRASLASDRCNTRRSFSSTCRVLLKEASVGSAASLTRKIRRKEWFESRPVPPANRQARTKMSEDKYALRKELLYLNDPLKLADHVRQRLREDEFHKTLAIVRGASATVQCTVSWNHLIDWQLNKGKMNDAIKTFNEMKSRAQVPDAHTYTILFRGCAEHSHVDQALVKVMSLYKGMSSERSAVRPNIIHANAVLKMCARAGDIDTLFAVANDLPTVGPTAPNNLTYTTIFNGLKMDAISEVPGGRSPMQKRQVRREAIARGRQLWPSVTTSWRKGDIWLDEELVCAMGRLLETGVSSDVDDIPSLIEQTMNIPRQYPRGGYNAQSTIAPQRDVQTGKQEVEEQEAPNENTEFVDLVTFSAMSVEDSQMSLVQQLTELKKSHFGPPTMGGYAKPRQNTLSLIMKAMYNLRLKAPAMKYWDIFTRLLGVVPDGDNYHVYMRILRVSRASTEAVQLLQQMPKVYRAPKTFRITMSTCERNKLSRHAFSDAGKILDVMQTSLEVPDIPTLISYLSVAISSPAKAASESANTPVKYAQGQQILRALDRLNPSFVNIKSLFAYGDPTNDRKDRERTSSDFKEDLILLTQMMIRANDTIMNQAMVPREQFSEITKQRNKLSAFVTRMKTDGYTPLISKPHSRESPSADYEGPASPRKAFA